MLQINLLLLSAQQNGFIKMRHLCFSYATIFNFSVKFYFPGKETPPFLTFCCLTHASPKLSPGMIGSNQLKMLHDKDSVFAAWQSVNQEQSNGPALCYNTHTAKHINAPQRQMIQRNLSQAAYTIKLQSNIIRPSQRAP